MKETFRRALRTFLQAAAGFISANIASYLTGASDGTVVEKALVALFGAAVACGIAAVMNLPPRQEQGKEPQLSEEAETAQGVAEESISDEGVSNVSDSDESTADESISDENSADKTISGENSADESASGETISDENTTDEKKGECK